MINERLSAYLARFQRTVTISEYRRSAQQADLIALRHDIDYDLDLALEAAHLEHRRGLRASYFLLPTAPYWNDPAFAAKVKQLAAYGHEIGLHVNSVAAWAKGQIDDIAADLRERLAKLRACGVPVTGVSAHGDIGCYQHDCTNYWQWRELRPKDPLVDQNGRSAEGNRVGEQERRLSYPTSHRLRRGDGATFDLWSLRLGDFGLEYDAFHVAEERYWSDSGGSWRRTGDPMESDLSQGRHQVLMHPIHWRAPRRAIFVLFAARSGSTWLTNFVASATSCQAVHEWSLNHRFDPATETFIQEKRTGTDFVGLMDRPDEAMKLLRETQTLFQRGTLDLFEANTYLEPFAAQLKDLFPECVIVHLHRDGRDVVRSILERGWYGAPDERKHAKLAADTGDLDQFSRACLYWKQTNDNIAAHTDKRLCYERMVSDRAYLEAFIASLGMVVHPLLADEAFPKRLNASRSQDIPGQSEWPQSAQDAYARICGPTHRKLGYALEGSDNEPSLRSAGKPPESASVARSVVDLSFAIPVPGLNRWIGRPWNHSNFLCESAADGLRLNMKKADRISWLALHRGSWKRCRKAQIAVEPGRYYRFRLEATCLSGQTRLFALSYNARGKLIEPSMLGVILPDKGELVGAFVTPRGCAKLTLAVQCMKNAQNVLLRSLKVEEVLLPERYLARDLLIPAGA